MPDRIVYCTPLVEDIKVSHLNLLFSSNDKITNCESRSAPAAACGQVGRIDNAMRSPVRGLLRKSVIFFENIDWDHGPWFASRTRP